MSVGVAVFDEDHKRIVDLINELHDAIDAGHGHKALGAVIDNLLDYACTHCRREEALFDQTGYPETAEHKKEHDAFYATAAGMKERFKSEANSRFAIEVMNYMYGWLVNHIQGSDKLYAPHLNAAGIH
jgi:hemerythrin